MATDPPPTERADTTRMVVLGLIVLAVVWFAVGNRQRVNINWWFFDRESRLIYVIVVSAILGVVADRLWIRRSKGDRR